MLGIYLFLPLIPGYYAYKRYAYKIIHVTKNQFLSYMIVKKRKNSKSHFLTETFMFTEKPGLL